MARGAPDYSNVTSLGVTHRLDDMGELAARLGSPAICDRSGTVSLIDDFRFGKTILEEVTAGLGETIEVSSLYSRYGGYTIKLTRVANVGSYAMVRDRASAIETEKIGGEALFVVMDNATAATIYLARRNGAVLKEWGLKWDGTTGKVYVGGSSIGWTETGDVIQQRYGYPLLHSMKLVGNSETGKHERAVVDGYPITMPDKDAHQVADNTSPETQMSFAIATGPSTAATIYLDALIVTLNEP